MADYIPGPDGDFDTWQTNWMNYAGAHLAALNISAARFAQLQALQLIWRSGRDGRVAAQAAVEASTQAQTAGRNPYEGALREESQVLQNRGSTTNEQRAGLQITVPDSSPTPVGPPTTPPVGRIDASQRLKHTVHFVDSGTPTSKAKPAGVQGCEIRMKVGDPAPTGPNDLEFVTIDSKTPHTIDFEASDAGKRVVYWIRWVSKRGEPGPWGAPISALIQG